MIARRNFIQLAGLGGLASVLQLAMPIARSRAGGQSRGAAPKRTIFISHCHGWAYDGWKLRPAGLLESVPWQIDLGAMAAEEFSTALAPLYDHRRRIVAVDGLSLASAELDSDGNRHDRGWVHAWTGNFADFGNVDTRSQSASLDQLVAAHIARVDRLPSLEIEIMDANERGRPISYGAAGVRLPAETSPRRAWDRLFGGATSGNPGGAKHRAAINFAMNEYKALAPSLDGIGRAQLDAHYSLLERVATRISGLEQLSCEIPGAPAGEFASFDARFDAFADVIAAGFACDAVRSVSISLGELAPADFGAGAISDNVHKGIAHDIYGDAGKHAAMVNYAAKHAEQVARLIRTLESMPDSDGRSIMDNTMIVWGAEMADGWHGYEHYCPLIIGGDWHFAGGRYLYWPHQTPVEILAPVSRVPGGWTQFSGLPHQHFLVSIARSVGLDVDHIGLRHLRGQRGDFVDCTGPLLGLKP